jgi:hypothetical protein
LSRLPAGAVSASCWHIAGFEKLVGTLGDLQRRRGE